jgi:hypothetical protein
MGMTPAPPENPNQTPPYSPAKELPWYRRWSFPSRPLAWLLAAVIGAFLGAFGKSIYEQAIPALKVESVAISEIFHERFLENRNIEIPHENPVIRDMNAHEWTPAFQVFGRSMGAREFVDRLKETESKLEQLVWSIERYRAARERFRDLLEAPPSQIHAERFFDLFSEHDAFLYGAIRGDFRRGMFEILGRYNDDESSEVFFRGRTRFLLLQHERGRLDDGREARRWSVSKRGGLFSSGLGARPPSEYSLARAMGHALAYFDQEFLKLALEQADKELHRVDTHISLKQRVNYLRLGYSRLVVTMTLTNLGIQPVTFGAGAKAVIYTEHTAGIDRNIDVEFINLSADGLPEPITVEGGRSKVVRFVSTRMIVDIDKTNLERFVDAYRAGDKNIVVRVTSSSPNFISVLRGVSSRELSTEGRFR